MTKKQVIARVAKLHSLAQGSSNEHERLSAASRAAALMAEHHLSEDDLIPETSSPSGSHPFDQFAEKVRRYALKNPVAHDLLGHPVFIDVLTQAQADLPASSKDRLLAKIGSLLALSSMLGLTTNKTVSDVKNIYDKVTMNKK